MARIDLTQEEVKALLDLLQYHHSELRMEIAGTDSRQFREQLKKEKNVLKGVRAKLEQVEGRMKAEG